MPRRTPKPRRRTIRAETVSRLRSGQNPTNRNPKHAAWLPRTKDPLALHRFVRVQGRAPSYTAMADFDCMVETIARIAAGCELNFGKSQKLIAVITKHGIACGAAVRDMPKTRSLTKMSEARVECLEAAMEGDLKAIFGGEVITNFPIGKEEAEALRTYKLGSEEKPRPMDLVVAPSFSDEAVRVLIRAKEDECIMLANPALARLGINSPQKGRQIRGVRGGFIEEQVNLFIPRIVDDAGETMRIHGDVNRLTSTNIKNLVLAWAVGSTSPGNAVAITFMGRLLANGVGAQSRIQAANAAGSMAYRFRKDFEHWDQDFVAYSNGFFPFDDSLRSLSYHGVRVVMAPMGSMNDEKIAITAGLYLTLVHLPKSARGFYRH